MLLLAGLANAKRPNILFILTDDQDLRMESVEHMPFLRVLEHPTAEKTSF